MFLIKSHSFLLAFERGSTDSACFLFVTWGGSLTLDIEILAEFLRRASFEGDLPVF
jgi:hypothetical protein